MQHNFYIEFKNIVGLLDLRSKEENIISTAMSLPALRTHLSALKGNTKDAKATSRTHATCVETRIADKTHSCRWQAVRNALPRDHERKNARAESSMISAWDARALNGNEWRNAL